MSNTDTNTDILSRKRKVIDLMTDEEKEYEEEQPLSEGSEGSTVEMASSSDGSDNGSDLEGFEVPDGEGETPSGSEISEGEATDGSVLLSENDDEDENSVVGMRAVNRALVRKVQRETKASLDKARALTEEFARVNGLVGRVLDHMCAKSPVTVPVLDSESEVDQASSSNARATRFVYDQSKFLGIRSGEYHAVSKGFETKALNLQNLLNDMIENEIPEHQLLRTLLTKVMCMLKIPHEQKTIMLGIVNSSQSRGVSSSSVPVGSGDKIQFTSDEESVFAPIMDTPQTAFSGVSTLDSLQVSSSSDEGTVMAVTMETPVPASQKTTPPRRRVKGKRTPLLVKAPVKACPTSGRGSPVSSNYTECMLCQHPYDVVSWRCVCVECFHTTSEARHICFACGDEGVRREDIGVSDVVLCDSLVCESIFDKYGGL